MLSLSALITAAVVACAAGQKAASLIPLSGQSYSFKRGNPASNVVVELYVDLTCSSCLDEWPTLNEVVSAYSSDVNFLYHIFPLPYHQQAFVVSKAANCVNYYASSADAVFTFMDTAFANQGDIYTSTTADMTYNEVVAMVGSWAINGTGLSEAQYLEGMDSSTTAGNAIEMNTRYMFKFSTLHDVYATPMFAINGEKVMGLNSFETWAATLDPLLEVSNKWKMGL